MSKKYLLLSILTILLIFTLPIHTDVSAKKNKEKTSEETSEAD
jgi:hypothetical protein